MLKRRNFLKQTGAAALGGLLLPNKSMAAFFNKPVAHPLGVQLFTFFNVIDNDVAGTLKKVAAIGYKEIESAFSRKGGYYGMKPKEFASMLNSMGLVWQSHHVLGAPFKLPPGAKMPAGADGKPISIPPMNAGGNEYWSDHGKGFRSFDAADFGFRICDFGFRREPLK